MGAALGIKFQGESTLWCKQKNYHNFTIFDTCGTLIYHNGCLEIIL
jgi:hypothetical protein